MHISGNAFLLRTLLNYRSRVINSGAAFGGQLTIAEATDFGIGFDCFGAKRALLRRRSAISWFVHMLRSGLRWFLRR
jgi:hypothetical protein